MLSHMRVIVWKKIYNFSILHGILISDKRKKDSWKFLDNNIVWCSSCKEKSFLYWSETSCIYEWIKFRLWISYVKIVLIDVIFLPLRFVKIFLKHSDNGLCYLYRQFNCNELIRTLRLVSLITSTLCNPKMKYVPENGKHRD